MWFSFCLKKVFLPSSNLECRSLVCSKVSSNVSWRGLLQWWPVRKTRSRTLKNKNILNISLARKNWFFFFCQSKKLFVSGEGKKSRFSFFWQESCSLLLLVVVVVVVAVVAVAFAVVPVTKLISRLKLDLSWRVQQQNIVRVQKKHKRRREIGRERDRERDWEREREREWERDRKRKREWEVNRYFWQRCTFSHTVMERKKNVHKEGQWKHPKPIEIKNNEQIWNSKGEEDANVKRSE